MLLGFKRRFSEFVENGTKTHTIRALRNGRQIRPGDRLDCYVDPRQKTMRLLGRFPCVKVEEILIYERGDGTFGVVIEGVELSDDEKNALAFRDGFRERGRRNAFEVMTRFWRMTHAKHGKPLDFRGVVIHWKFGPPRRFHDASATDSSRVEIAWSTSKEGRQLMTPNPTEEPNAIELILALCKHDNAQNLCNRPGLWKRKLDDRWTIWLNAHSEPLLTDGDDNNERGGVTVHPYECYVQYNGWPAGIICFPTGDIQIAAGAAANYQTFCEAVQKAVES